MITDVNPFVYSHPLAPEDIIDRDDEARELLQNAVGGHFVRLFAPRKYGKTSLLKRALRDGEEHEGLIPVLVDLYRVSSLADVTVRFERAYSKHLKGALRSKVEEFLQKTGIGLSLGAFGISARLQHDPKVDPLPALHALLDRPLYGSAVPMRLQRLGSADIAAYVAARFSETGRAVGEALNPLLDAAKGH